MFSNIRDSALVIVVAHNNHVLLEHFVESIEKHNAGYPYELLIIDNDSTDSKHLDALTKLSKKYRIETYENDRVEVSFDKACSKYKNQHQYYFFVHDDTCINEDYWLKKYIERLKSNYTEQVINKTKFEKLPIGRVGSNHQPWRDYNSIIGYPIRSEFVHDYLATIFLEEKIPTFYKFVDPERVLYSNDCLVENNIFSLNDFYAMKQKNIKAYKRKCEALNKTLLYPDEGISPKSKYPPGECWNKMTMLTEFMNSIFPLINGFRSVGLEGDGFLEQRDGPDNPWGHRTVIHYGSPNLKRFLANKFNTTGEEIHKKLYSKDKAFLVHCDKLIRGYFK